MVLRERKRTLMLVLARTTVLIIKLLPHLIQQFRQPAIWRRHHPAMRVVHAADVLVKIYSDRVTMDSVIRIGGCNSAFRRVFGRGPLTESEASV